MIKLSAVEGRNYFGNDAVFETSEPALQALIDGYREAWKRFIESAASAVRVGDLAHMRRAQWDLATVAALETALNLFYIDPDDSSYSPAIFPADPPDFR